MANPDSFLANNEALIAYNNGIRHSQTHAHNENHLDKVKYPNRIDSFDETANRYYTYDDDPQ